MTETGAKRRVLAGVAVVAMLVLGPTPVGAQGRPDGGSMGRGRFDAMMDSVFSQLDLTDEQVPLVKGIVETSRARRQEVLGRYGGRGGRGDFRAMRGQMQQIRAEMEEQLETVLTQEQMDRFRALRSNLEERVRSRRGKRRGARGA